MVSMQPDAVRSIVALLQQRAQQTPDAALYTYSPSGGSNGTSLSYALLHRRAIDLAAWLQDITAPRDRIVLAFEPGADFIVAFYGCLYAGRVAVPVAPSRGTLADTVTVVGRDCLASTCLTTGETARRLAVQLDSGTTGICVLDLADASAGGVWKDPEAGPGTLAFLQYTSGSTGAPKGVRVSHGNLLSNLELIHRKFGHGPASRGVIWLPPYHDMGLIGGILTPLYGGFPVTLMSPLAMIQQPVRWLEAISRHRATTSGGPNFAYELCVRRLSDAQLDGLDLSTWRVAFGGAEPVRAAVLKAFATRFAPVGFRGDSFRPCYGLAEATLMVTAGEGSALPTLYQLDRNGRRGHPIGNVLEEACSGRTVVGCGSATYDGAVVIVDPETGHRLPDGHVGEIWVCGASICDGYWTATTADRQALVGTLPEHPAVAFLRTGDLGLLSAGELVVTGRIKDLLIIRGRNHYPQDLEACAQESHPALRAGGAAAFAVDEHMDRPVIVQEVRRRKVGANTSRAAVEAIVAAISRRHGLTVGRVCLVAPGGLPRTASGKICRRQCRDMFLRGELAEIVPTAHGALAEGE
jgi:acyl-CoA synthetase (AMP-forming)/AMP-acid ligase II